jgi:ubiquinone biosynthesis protein Coq4
MSMPSLLTRLRVGAYHGARILFLRWPGYTFDDLAAVQDCLDGPAFQNAARKLAQDVDGERLLSQAPELGIHTVDWQALSLLPIDTLGYNLWHHFYSHGLLHTVHLGPPKVQWGAKAEFAKSRYRATHDLRHVMLGLGVEGYEEVVLQTFQCAQLYQNLSALIVSLGGLKHALIDGKWREILSLAPRAWRVGRRARFLLNMPVEEMWEQPLEAVRAHYGIQPVGPHYPVSERHSDAGRSFDVAA